jgi:hypothetical protein
VQAAAPITPAAREGVASILSSDLESIVRNLAKEIATATIAEQTTPLIDRLREQDEKWRQENAALQDQIRTFALGEGKIHTSIGGTDHFIAEQPDIFMQTLPSTSGTHNFPS